MRSAVQVFTVSAGLVAALAWGQQASRPPAAEPGPAFEVASVKPAADPGRAPMICLVPCSPGERMTVEHSRVDIRYMSLERLLITAYAIKGYQLSGPDWMRSQRFDVQAKMPDGASRERLPEMLQSLLAERFKLAIHRESKDLPVYALVLKGESKLQAAREQDLSLPDTPGTRELYTPDGEARMLADGTFMARGGPLGPIRGGGGPDRGIRFEFLSLTMPGLALLLTPHMDRPVVDQTGLKGGYYVDLPIRPPEGAGGGRKGEGAPEGGRSGLDNAPAGPRQDPFGDALFTVIERAGLKLEKTKAPVETIVVDHLEKTPTEN